MSDTVPTLPDWFAELTSPMDELFGTEWLEITPERVVCRAEVDGHTQPAGLWHGGASALLLESAASIGAWAHGRPERLPVGVDLNITHLRAARSGHVTCTATAIHLGRQIAVYEALLTDDSGHRLAIGRLTCHFVPESFRTRL